MCGYYRKYYHIIKSTKGKTTKKENYQHQKSKYNSEFVTALENVAGEHCIEGVGTFLT
jgi:hypothetical protein